MAKLNWDRAAVERTAKRNGSEYIETEIESHKGMTALLRWKDLTISLRENRKQQIRRIRLIKKEGTVISFARRQPEEGRDSHINRIITIDVLAKELSVMPMAIVRYACSIGFKVSSQRQNLPRHIAKRIRRHFRR